MLERPVQGDGYARGSSVSRQHYLEERLEGTIRSANGVRSVESIGGANSQNDWSIGGANSPDDWSVEEANSQDD